MANKRYFSVLFVLLLLNAAVFSLGSCKQNTGENTRGQSPETEINKLDSAGIAELHDTECYHGGPGNKSCSIPAGIEINGSVTIECSVTCSDGYYACCGLSCICRPEENGK